MTAFNHQPAGKGERDWFLHLNGHRLLLLVHVGGLGELNVAHADIAGRRKLDALLGAGDDERLAKLTQVTNDALELCTGHLDDGGVVGLGDAKVLCVQVHQLHLVIGDLVLVRRLEHEGHSVGVVLRLDRDDVVVGRALQDLRHGAQVHAHSQLPVASELVESVGPQGHGDQGDVTVVHGLELDASIATVPRGLVQQVLQGLKHLKSWESELFRK